MIESIEPLAEFQPEWQEVATAPYEDPRPGREAVDFFRVEEKHFKVHARLENWATWANGTGRPAMAPMFRMYRSAARVRENYAIESFCVDTADASKISKAVAALPEKHRGATNWAYLRPVSPRKACQALGTSPTGLAQLLRDARQMLVNRGE